MAIFIIFYIIGVISVGVYFYKSFKTKLSRIEGIYWFCILLLAIFFPITFILGWLMIIIEKIGDKLCKNQKKN